MCKGQLPLGIETGWFNGLPGEERLSLLCDLDKICFLMLFFNDDSGIIIHSKMTFIFVDLRCS